MGGLPLSDVVRDAPLFPNGMAALPAMAFDLRPYQRDATAAVQREFADGAMSTLVVMATGLGKTVCFSWLARAELELAIGGRVLVVAHRTELITQAAKKLAAAGLEPAIEQGPQRAGDARVVVASVQTLKGKRLEAWAADSFTLIIFDEAHHATAPGYRAIRSRFASARLLGVTATPDRLDGVGLGEIFETVAYRKEMKDATDDGWLVPIVARRIEVSSVDLDAVKTRAGDFALDQLSEQMRNEAALHGVARPLAEQVEDRLTIVFAVDVAHAHALTDAINTYRPGAARAIDGTMPSSVRDGLLEGFAAREFSILVNVAILTEGVDVPAAACVAIARPTKSRALYTQMIGRAVRLLGATYAESVANGKPNALVLDFSGNSTRHKLIGPADCLASTEPEMLDGIRDELEQVLGEGTWSIGEAVAEAQQRYGTKRLRAAVEYGAVEIDPYIGKPLGVPTGDQISAQLAITGLAINDRRPMTEVQAATLERAGLKKLPDGVTVSLASAWISAIRDRSKRGLCTFKQARWLGKQGYDARAMTFDTAKRLMGELLGELAERKGQRW